MKITTAFVGADELVISDGVNTLVGALDADIAETGQFVVDLGYENVSAGGALECCVNQIVLGQSFSPA